MKWPVSPETNLVIHNYRLIINMEGRDVDFELFLHFRCLYIL
jgi:hypothetical protein